MILMKVTSRERPEQLKATINNVVSLAEEPQNLILSLSLDIDDTESIKALEEIQTNHRLNIDISDRTTKIGAINRGVLDSGWDILVNLSDDQRAVNKGWDRIIKNSMPKDLDASLWFFDGVQPRINTMEIVGRKYFERFGYIYYHQYKSFFCDNEATEVAIYLGKMIKSPEIVFKHHHRQSNQRMDKVDKLHELNAKFWKHDEELFYLRKTNRFGL